MAEYIYEDKNHSKVITAFDSRSAETQANSCWIIYSKSDEIDSAVLYDENLNSIKEYKK